MTVRFYVPLYLPPGSEGDTAKRDRLVDRARAKVRRDAEQEGYAVLEESARVRWKTPTEGVYSVFGVPVVGREA